MTDRRAHDREDEQRRRDDALRAELFDIFARAMREASAEELSRCVEATR